MPFCITINGLFFKLKTFFTSIFIIFAFSFIGTTVNSEEKIDSVIDQIQIILKDLKTLEKAVYKKSDISSSSSILSNNLNEDIMAKHFEVTSIRHSVSRVD